MYTDFFTVGKVPLWAPQGCYFPLIPLISLQTCIWIIRSSMSVTLFHTLASGSVTRFLAVLVGSVTVKRRVPILVNCLIDLALILPLVLIVVDPTLLLSLKRQRF